MKYITVKLTEDQAWTIANILELNLEGQGDKKQVAFEQRIIGKINKALAKAKIS